jgi:hypothetical protein
VFVGVFVRVFVCVCVIAAEGGRSPPAAKGPGACERSPRCGRSPGADVGTEGSSPGADVGRR